MNQAAPTYLRALFDLLDVGVLIADDEGRYVDANVAAGRLLGWPREELLGRRVMDFVAMEGAKLYGEAQWRHFLREGAQSGTIRLRTGDGGEREFSYHAYANFVPGLHCSFLMAAEEDEAEQHGDTVTVCAWTKRVRVGSAWVTMDEYLRRCYGVRVSHGICPEAMPGALAGAGEKSLPAE